MRTKKVFYSIAIAAALASCTAEDVELMAPNAPQQDLSNRPVLGNVELVTTTPFSRLATEGETYQPQWQEGDKMGAAIIDKALYTSKADYETKWEANVAAKLEDPYTGMYEIIQSYGSNANFDYSNGAYYLNADMPLVEGNYLFYAPYNKNMQYRSAMTVQVPAVQYGTTEMGALDHFYQSGAVVRVGYDFLAYNGGKAQRPNLTLFDVFSYPMFTIKNNFKGYLHKKNAEGNLEWVKYDGGTVEIDKIELYAMDSEGKQEVEVTLGGQLDHVAVKNCTELGTIGTNWEDKLFENKTTDLLLSDALTKTAVTTTSTHKITEVQINRNVALEGKIEVYAVMPAAKYNSLMAKVYLTIEDTPYVIERRFINVNEDGEVTKAQTSSIREILMTSEVGEINLVPGQRFPQEELNWDEELPNPLSAKGSAGSILTIDLIGGLKGGVQVAVDVTEEETTTPTTEYIDNNDEWIAVFKELQNGTALIENETPEFTFAQNTEAKIDAKIIKALNNYNNKGSLTLTKGLIIDNDVKVVAVNGDVVTFAADDVQYDITLSGDAYDVVSDEYENKYVKSSAGSLHVFNGVYYHADATIFKNISVNNLFANLNVATELDVESLINYGSIDASATIDGEITNNSIIAINGGLVELKIVAGKGTICGFNDILTSKVTIIGGEQQGVYNSPDGFENANQIAQLSWVNTFCTENNANVVLTNAIVNTLSNISTYVVSGLKFSESSVNLTGKTIEMSRMYNEELAEFVIEGKGTYHTTLTGLYIVNESSKNVKLSNVKATGTYVQGTNPNFVYGKLYTIDTATWNGNKINK